MLFVVMYHLLKIKQIADDNECSLLEAGDEVVPSSEVDHGRIDNMKTPIIEAFAKWRFYYAVQSLCTYVVFLH